MQHKQRGSTFWSWLMMASLAVFIGVTVIIIAPTYVQHESIKNMVNSIAAKSDPQDKGGVLIQRIYEYLNINHLIELESDDFSIVEDPQQKGKRALRVEYEVRKKWVGNIDFLLYFEHQANLGEAQ